MSLLHTGVYTDGGVTRAPAYIYIYILYEFNIIRVQSFFSFGPFTFIAYYAYTRARVNSFSPRYRGIYTGRCLK